MHALLGSWSRAQLAVVAWRSPAGVPAAAQVVPLVHDGTPVIALHHGQLDIARGLEQAADIALAVTTGPPARGASPSAAQVHATIEIDERGERFRERGLLDQELAKHPPSRRRLDNLVLQREHWWLLPRVLMRFEGSRDARSLDHGDALLLTGGETLGIRSCHLEVRSPLSIVPAPGPAVVAGSVPAAVFEHGADVPELERCWHTLWTGTWVDGRFESDRLEQRMQPERQLTLRERLRAERELERACVAGLRATGRA